MFVLALLRHGQSEWNQENRFTGWTNVGLTEHGVGEARNAARLFLKKGYSFDVCFTSLLNRAIKSLWIVLEEMDLMWLPVQRSWRLNERHYGALQGLNKAETARSLGEEKVFALRRGLAERPPPLDPTDPRHPCRDPRYASLSAEEIPVGESLKDTLERLMPYWHGTIVPEVRGGKRVLISAHGNTIRGLVKHLDGISDEDFQKLEIPTGAPLVYELDGDLKPLRHFYLGE